MEIHAFGSFLEYIGICRFLSITYKARKFWDLYNIFGINSDHSHYIVVILVYQRKNKIKYNDTEKVFRKPI